MKKLFIILIAAISCCFVNAQSVGIGTNAPNPKALLDISSTTKGVLLPRMTTSQRFDITTPPNGLVVYDTDKSEFYHHDGLGWKALLNSDYWRRPITSRKRISNLNDSVGINLSGTTEWLDVAGNIRSRNNLIVGNNVSAQGNVNGGSLSTGGNILVAGTSILSGNVTTNNDITINNTAAILQLKSSNVNKGFFQLSGNDVRPGTNSGNSSGNFRANASTGELFRVWIANCNSGGIPTVATKVAGFKIANSTLEFVMPFDGKASLVILNESGAIKNIIAENQVFQKGNVKIHKTNLQKVKGNTILIIDGAIAGRMEL